MRWNFPTPGKSHSLGQKKTAAVARIADAFGNSRSPGKPSGIERILQQQGHVKLLRAKFHGEPFAAEKTSVQAFWIVRDKLITNLLIAIKIHNVGPSHDRDFRVSKTIADHAQRRQRHDGVPHPVRSAY